MKKFSTIALSVVSSAICVLGFASAQPQEAITKTVSIKKAPVASVKPKKTIKANNTLVTLYASNKGKTVMKKVPANLRLIPIYQQGNWVKVGSPRDGAVGWINLMQYEKARAAYYRPDIQTLYVDVAAPKNHKPTLTVVAYKNGKKLNSEEAMKLYKQMRKRQENEYRKMQRFSLSMQQMMDTDFLDAQHFFNTSWFNPPWMEPVILIQAPKTTVTQPASPKKMLQPALKSVPAGAPKKGTENTSKQG